MRAGLTCISDKGGGGGDRDTGRQLERVPEQDRVEDAVRGEAHVQLPAAALFWGAAHAEVPRLDRLHEGAVHALRQWGACAMQDPSDHAQSLQSCLCDRAHLSPPGCVMLVQVSCRAGGRDSLLRGWRS